ncbi:MAG: hypothetical protein BWX92_03690 [Deltaproteobacteria bacterium ADurb.Bin135]|nr:MAG: hypothetical protein BWX92_03690 [Deltaproteobacteria bacterium ADurb.Bin135]
MIDGILALIGFPVQVVYRKGDQHAKCKHHGIECDIVQDTGDEGHCPRRKREINGAINQVFDENTKVQIKGVYRMAVFKHRLFFMARINIHSHGEKYAKRLILI